MFLCTRVNPSQARGVSLLKRRERENDQLIAAALVAVALARVAFGFFGIHTAFLDGRVSEAQPFCVPADPVVEPEMMGAKIETDTEAAAAAPAAAIAAPVEAAPEPAPTEVAEPTIRTLASGTIVSHAHTGKDTATVITDGTETFLRFEDDFAIDNGPDLNVYLVRGATATGDTSLFDDDFIDLADLKGKVGAHNYKLPMRVDITEHRRHLVRPLRRGL